MVEKRRVTTEASLQQNRLAWFPRIGVAVSNKMCGLSRRRMGDELAVRMIIIHDGREQGSIALSPLDSIRRCQRKQCVGTKHSRHRLSSPCMERRSQKVAPILQTLPQQKGDVHIDDNVGYKPLIPLPPPHIRVQPPSNHRRIIVVDIIAFHIFNTRQCVVFCSFFRHRLDCW